MTKGQLKLLIKECLLEILAEGLGAETVVETVMRRPASAKQERPKPQNFVPPARTIAESMRMVPHQQQVMKSPAPSPVKQPQVPQVFAGGIDMTSILQDTAASTFVQQNMAEGRGYAGVPAGADKLALVVAQHEPEEIFGSSVASKWADLAFSNK